MLLSLSRVCVCVCVWGGLEPGLCLSGRCWALDKGECQAMWIKDVGL